MEKVKIKSNDRDVLCVKKLKRDLKCIKFFMYMTYFLCLIIICMLIATNA